MAVRQPHFRKIGGAAAPYADFCMDGQALVRSGMIDRPAWAAHAVADRDNLSQLNAYAGLFLSATVRVS